MNVSINSRQYLLSVDTIKQAESHVPDKCNSACLMKSRMFLHIVLSIIKSRANILTRVQSKAYTEPQILA